MPPAPLGMGFCSFSRYRKMVPRIDPQVAGSLGSIAIVSFKHLEDILSLKSSFAFSSGMIAVSWLAPRSRSSGVRSDLIAKNKGLLETIFELPNVPGPTVLLNGCQCGGTETTNGAVKSHPRTSKGAFSR